MGSIVKRPKAPPVQEVIRYVPQPQTVASRPVVTPEPERKQDSTASTDSNPVTPKVEDTPTTAAQVRKANLLRRERGRLGTILTGFRGILGLREKTRNRKTLLGE